MGGCDVFYVLKPIQSDAMAFCTRLEAREWKDVASEMYDVFYIEEKHTSQDQ